MSNVDRVNWESNERVDIPDIQELTRSIAAHAQAVVAGVVNEDTPYVARGFATSLVDTTTVRVTAGSEGAIIGVDPETGEPGQIVNGTTGTATRDYDFGDGPDPYNTYKVYITITQTEGASDNRAYWNATTGAEYVLPTNTRLLTDWSVAVTTGSVPSGSVQVAEVVWDGGLVAGDITDKRFTLFEGDLSLVQSSSGVASHSTSSDRSTNHLASLAEFAQAMLKEVQEIKSNYWDRDGSGTGHAWYTALPTGLSLRSAQSVVFTVGDGTNSFGNYNANDTAYSGDASGAIQDAIDAANAAVGGVVIIKEGSYTCSTTIDLEGTSVYRLSILGHGAYATRLQTTMDAPLFRLKPTVSGNNVRIAGLSIRHDNTVSTAMVDVDLSSLSSETIQEVRLEDVRFYSYTSTAINTGISVSGGSATETLNRLSLVRCEFDNLERCFSADQVTGNFHVNGCSSRDISSYIGVTTDCSNVVVSGCGFDGTSNIPVLRLGDGTTNAIVKGCTFSSSAIDLQDAAGIILSGNAIDASAGLTPPVRSGGSEHVSITGNYLVGSRVGVLSANTQSVDDVSIANNIIQSNANGVLVTSGATYVCRNVSIVGNVLSEETYGSGASISGCAGITASNCPGAAISSNSVFRVGLVGIYTSGSPSSAITGNVVVDDDYAGGQDLADRIMTTGIYVTTGSTETAITGNMVLGTQEYGVRVTTDRCMATGNYVNSVDSTGSPVGAFQFDSGDMIASGNYALSCTGYGFSITQDYVTLSGCVAKSVTGDGFNLNNVSHCTLSDCRATSCGGDGFDAESSKAGAPNKFFGCLAVSSTGKGFTVANETHLQGCVASGNTAEAFLSASSSTLTMRGCQALVAKGVAAIYPGAGSAYSLIDCYITISGSAPAASGVLISGGTGKIIGCHITGQTGMSGESINISSAVQALVQGCIVDVYNTFGIDATGSIVFDGCIIKGITAKSSPTCMRIGGDITVSNCLFFPDTASMSILTRNIVGSIPVITGNQILGSPSAQYHIDQVNSNGAIISFNRAEQLATTAGINLNNNDYHVVVGNRGLTRTGTSGTGNQIDLNIDNV